MLMKGSVFHHPKFVFKDGEIGNKLLVLLNTPQKNDPYLIVKTTSQETSQQITRPKIPGCNQVFSVFFVPCKGFFFDKDTWIILDEIYPFTPDSFTKDPDLKKIGDLDLKLTDKVIDCLLLVGKDDITPAYEKLLKTPLQKGLEQLLKKYGKKH